MASLAVLVSAACFGTFGVFSLLFFDGGGDPFALVFLRTVAGAVAFVAVLLIRRERILPGRSELSSVLVGLFQAGANWMLFEGFTRGPTGAAVLAFYSFPLWVHIGAARLFGERIGSARMVALGVGIVGEGLIAGFSASSSAAVGIAFGLGGSLFATGTILSARHALAGGVTPLQLAGRTFLFPAVLLSIPALGGLQVPTGAEGWMGYAGVAVIGTVLPITLIFFGIERLGAATASLLSLMEPVAAVLLGYAFLDERLATIQAIGWGLILASVVATVVRVRAARPAASAPSRR